MTKILILSMLITTILFSDEFDIVDVSKQKKIIFPLTKKEIRKYIPLIPRMLTKEEQLTRDMKIAEEKALKKSKVSNNFAKKETLQEVEKVKTKVKANGADADFFNSLADGDSKPIDME